MKRHVRLWSISHGASESEALLRILVSGNDASAAFDPPHRLTRRHLRFTFIDTLTFLSTDIEGSTSLLRHWGNGVYATALADHHRIVRESLTSHGGHEEATQGDSFFATFTSPSAAVTAAIQMQRSLAAYYWPGGEELRVRMGVHTGEVSETMTGLVGYEVHRAARIAAVGYGGQVLLSSATAGLVEESLASDVSLRNLGAHRLKDLGRPETIFQLLAPGLRAEFPNLRSLDNPELPNNLPASLNPFIGRREEIEEVRSLILISRLVTLTGAGGSGKTRLALQTAAEMLDGSGEGVWMVDLAPLTDPDQVPVRILTSLEIAVDSQRPPFEALQLALRDQNVLIVLDNCEHLIDTIAKLADLLTRTCPKIRLMTTSREPLGVDGEEVYRVRSLSMPTVEVTGVDDLAGCDAVELFVARARSHDKTFALTDGVAPSVASICARLDGIPLAIELAAARLSSMSLKDLNQRLDQRFRLLTGGSRNALPRQQTLGAMVAWSFDLLTAPELEVVRRLSVFVNGFDLEAAEAVCSTETIDSFDIADLLASLVNKSLVIADRTGDGLRYRLLETIRQYSADQMLQVGGEDQVIALRRQHAEYFLDLAERGYRPSLCGLDQVEWLDRISDEWGNVVAALGEFTADPGSVESVLRLGVATYVVASLQRHRETMIALHDALGRAEDVPTSLRAAATMRTWLLDTWIPNWELPMDERQRRRHDGVLIALHLARDVGDRALECEALSWLSWNSQIIDGPEELTSSPASRAYAEDALSIARELGDPWLLGVALYYFAYTEPRLRPQRLGPTGVAYLRQAHEIFQRVHDLRGVNVTTLGLSLSCGDEWADVPEFVRLTEESLAISERIRDVELVNNATANLSIGKALLGDFPAAQSFARAALVGKRRQGAPPWQQVFTILTFVYCMTDQGHYERAAVLRGGAEALIEQIPAESGYAFSPLETETLDNNGITLTAQLGAENYEAQRAVGRRLTFDEISHLALQRRPTTA